MNIKSFCCFLLLILVASLPAHAQHRQKPDQVRDAFLVTRDAKLVSQTDKPAQKPRAIKTNSRSSSAAPGALGLGYTVFKKNADGKPVRVNPEQVFREGDGVRFMVESNETGYLYIFYTEKVGTTKMIFPDPRLDGGVNQIKAHVPREVPSKEEPGDWWFFFDEKAATERFYLIITRQPLAGVKTGETLVAAYEKNPSAHPWQPTKATWQTLLAQAGTSQVSKGREFGASQTEAEQVAVVRGGILRPSAPAPSVVRMSTSPKTGMLVAQIALLHR